MSATCVWSHKARRDLLPPAALDLTDGVVSAFDVRYEK